MCDDSNIELSRFRIKRAKEDLATAKDNLSSGRLRAANNRLYYALFHALRAVLSLNNYDSSKHRGIISEFRLLYIKTGIFPKEMSDVIQKAFELRNHSDYSDLFIPDPTETQRLIENVSQVVDTIDMFLTDNNSS